MRARREDLGYIALLTMILSFLSVLILSQGDLKEQNEKQWREDVTAALNTLFAQSSSQYYYTQLGDDHTGMYGSNWTVTSLTAATTGTALIVPDASKRLVIEKVIVTTDDELDLELAAGTTSVQGLPTLHLGYRGGMCYDPYIALPTAATFWCITTDTANYEIWTRYRQIP